MEQPERSASASLKARLGLECGDMPLLEVALTHRSYSFERPDLPNYERLEFLGDAVLGLVVTDIIFRWFPELPEGDLAKLRSSSVNTTVLAIIARSLGLGDDLFLGRGEELSGGRDKDSILADSFEAVLGAAYLDCGFDRIRDVIEKLFTSHIRKQFEQGVLRDFKTHLQEHSVQIAGVLPDYRVSFTGPDHSRTFLAEVYVAGAHLGSGKGRSKKQAEQAAAEQALARLAEDPLPSSDARAT
jgi:ribonuclease III